MFTRLAANSAVFALTGFALGISPGFAQGADPPAIAINNAIVSEGNVTMLFTVTLTGSVSGVFTVPFSTSDGTAMQPGDYESTNGFLVFLGLPGETKAISVKVLADTILELNETFTVELGTPSNGSIFISDGSGLGTIVDDDSAYIAINDVIMDEGHSGTSSFDFTVNLTGAVQGGFSVPFSVENGTATQPDDYASNSGTLNFAGSTSETETITVTVVGDAVLESNETFSVILGTPIGAPVQISDGTGLGTITNDDAASIAINNVTLAEGNSETTTFDFTVSLSGAVQGGFSVPFSTENGAAMSPVDYASTSGTLNFSGSAEETETVTIDVVGDLEPETNENFFVNLDSATGGVSITQHQGTGLILNDDLFADISVSNSDGVGQVISGGTTTYTVMVGNTSAIIDVAAVKIVQQLPEVLINVAWTCMGSGGAVCPDSGSGAIDQSLALTHNSSVTFLVTATVNNMADEQPPTVDTSVTATVLAPNSDPDTSNNTATDSNLLIGEVLLRDGFEEDLGSE